MIRAGQLAHMKRTAYLVNVGRGAIVDLAGLTEALRTGVIAGAGQDGHRPGVERPVRPARAMTDRDADTTARSTPLLQVRGLVRSMLTRRTDRTIYLADGNFSPGDGEIVER